MGCCSCNTEVSTSFVTGFLPVLIIKSRTRDLTLDLVIGRFFIHDNKFLNRRRPLLDQGFCFACAFAVQQSLLVTTTNQLGGKKLLQQGRQSSEKSGSERHLLGSLKDVQPARI